MGKFKTSDIINAIRNGAGEAFKERIPEATQENLAELATAITEYEPDRNYFVSALMDKFALQIARNAMFENPLREFKGAMLTHGKDIEELFVDLVTAQVYDPEKAETEVFKRNLPDIKAVFHRENRQYLYKTTIHRDELRKALLSEDGLENLVNKIVQALYVGDSYDEFLIMKHLIAQYAIEGKFAVEVVAPVTDEATAKAALAKIKEVSNKMTFISDKYNYAGVKTCTLKPDQVILVTPEFEALLGVEVLAYVFNMDKAELNGRVVLIDDFGGLENVLCAVVDKNFFMVYDTVFDSSSIYNQDGRYYNYVLHHHGIMSVSPFANAVLFVTEEPEITELKVYPETANVTPGQFLQLRVEVEGDNYPPSKVKFEADDEAVIINSMGLVYIGKNAVGDSDGIITITATSVYDDQVTATVELQLPSA